MQRIDVQEKDVQKIGFIGLGNIGGPMARRIREAGHALVVHDLRRQAAERVLAEGAEWADSPRELARSCRLVLTSLPGPAEVEAVVGGADGLLAGAERGDVHVDLTTSSFAMARTIAEREAERGVLYLDAPVSGGAAAAEKGALSIMASGPRAAFDAAKPAFDALGDPAKTFHLGEEVGTGTLVKLINNAIFLASGLVTQECLVLAAKAGLDTAQLLDVLKASSASIYTGLAELFAARGFDNVFFSLALATKDLKLALDSGRDLGVDMGVTEAAHRLYDRAREQGLGDKVFFATLRALEDAAGALVAPPRRGS